MAKGLYERIHGVKPGAQRPAPVIPAAPRLGVVESGPDRARPDGLRARALWVELQQARLAARGRVAVKEIT